jgi:microcystin-dependent protein
MIETIGDITSFKWATVMSTAPLSIKLDGDTAALAMVPDSLVDPLSLSVSQRVRVELSLRKCVIHGVSNGSGAVEPGRVELTAAAGAPSGWLICDGSSLLRASYPRLFAAIGTAHGAVDANSFSLPDLRGRVAVGRDAGQVEFDVLGEKGGSKGHTHSPGSMAAAIGATSGDPNRIGYVANVANVGGGPASSTYSIAGVAGGQAGAQPFNHYTPVYGTTADGSTLQPYTALNYIIKI